MILSPLLEPWTASLFGRRRKTTSRTGTLLAGFMIQVILAAGPAPVWGEPSRDQGDLATEEHLGEHIPLDVRLLNENGAEVMLGDLFETGSQKPVILIPSYYTCPRLCTYVFNAVQKAAAEVRSSRGLTPGRDYTILSVSFRPEDTPAVARKKGDGYRGLFQPPLKPEAWRFLTGDADQVARLMDAVGYRYRPDGDDDYSHGAAIVMLSPGGKITRYLYGVNFQPGVFRLSLIESSYGKIGNTVERIFLYCFRYDEQEGKYTPAVWVFVRGGGLLTLAFIVGLIFLLRRKEKG
ncbi:MAG: SCO family protein [Leptospirales bacterium]